MLSGDPLFTGDFAARTRRALLSVLRTLMVIMPVLAIVTMPVSKPVETVLMVALGVIVAGLFLLARAWRLRKALALLVLVLVGYGCAGVIAFGSIRSISSMAFVGAIVVGGLFLRRDALTGVVVLCAACIGALVWAENAGWIGPARFAVGPLHWIVHVAVLGAIALNIHYARGLMLEALARSERDTMERLRAERALGEAEEVFEALFRNSPAALMMTAYPGETISDINRAHSRMFGHAREDIVGRTSREPGLWAQAEARADFMATIGAGRVVLNRPARFRRANGEEFDTLLSAQLVDWRGGRHLLSVVTDISTEMRLRDSVREAEQRFRMVFRYSPIGMVITNFDFATMVDANAAFLDMLGLPHGTGIGTLVRSAYVDPAEHAAARAALEARGVIRDHPVRLRHADGGVREMRLSAAVFHDGKSRMTVNMLVDITEENRMREALKASEERFSRAFHFSPIGMTITRLSDGRILEVNRADERVLGYSYGETVGRTTLETGAFASAEERERFVEILRSEGRVLGYEARMRNKAGEIIDTRTFAERIEINGEACVLGAVLNITEEKRQSAEIRALNESLEQRVQARTAEVQAANAELEAFVYAVSHDLRAPLRSINGFVQFLDDEIAPSLTPTQADYMRRVRQGGARMDQLIEDLLRLSRIGRQKLFRNRVDLSVMAREVIEIMEARQRDRAAEWQVEPGMVVDCDAALMRIVLENLLGNAWKYTSKRTDARIRFGLDAAAKREGRAVFVIEDNGAGFDMRFAERLFKPFQRLHSQSEFDGNGVGLSTVKRIVESHGGGIEVTAAPGEGATVRFTLQA